MGNKKTKHKTRQKKGTKPNRGIPGALRKDSVKRPVIHRSHLPLLVHTIPNSLPSPPHCSHTTANVGLSLLPQTGGFDEKLTRIQCRGRKLAALTSLPGCCCSSSFSRPTAGISCDVINVPSSSIVSGGGFWLVGVAAHQVHFWLLLRRGAPTNSMADCEQSRKLASNHV